MALLALCPLVVATDDGRAMRDPASMWIDSNVPPSRMVWAWERPTDLRFLEGRAIGVAFYGATVRVDGSRTRVEPRRSPLRLAPSTYRMAVLRIEAAEGTRIEATPPVVSTIVDEARRLLALPSVRGLQLDFDARGSERAAHAAFVRALRAGLPPRTFLSVTSLASHCFGDPLTGASVDAADEIVPMYFRMADDDRVVRRALLEHGEPPVRHCRPSAGVADDETRPHLSSVSRLYVFLTGPVDARALDATFASFPVSGAR